MTALATIQKVELYPDRLGEPVTIIGTGGIGSTLAPMVVRAGVKRLTLWDFDRVEPVNLEMQNFSVKEVGQLKSQVVAWRALDINPSLDVRPHAVRFTQHDVLDGIVLCAVDSIRERGLILESLTKNKDRVRLYVDGRLTRTGSFLDIYIIDPRSEVEMENYRASLTTMGNEHKSPRADCMTAHVPYMLSGLIGVALANWANGRSHPWKVTYDAAMQHTERYYA
jgi:molybdopterin/thiamine biosynthesis adenylyltransferase